MTDSNDKAEYEGILVLQNEAEAVLLQSLLEEAEIPHYIRTYEDLSYDGIWREQKGWGTVFCRSDDADRIREIFADRVERKET